MTIEPAPSKPESRVPTRLALGPAGTAGEATVRARPDLLVIATTGLFVLACVYTLYFGREVVLPIVIAMVLFVVMTPIVRRLSRRGVPNPISAAVIVFSLFGMLMFGIYSLSEPVSEWRDRAPQIISELEGKLWGLKQSIEEVKKASEDVEGITEMAEGEKAAPEVVVKSPGLLQRLLGGLQQLGVQLVITLVLLYFLLASGEIFTEKLLKSLPTLSDKKVALTIVRQVEREVSTYLLTITLINIGLGAAIGLGLYTLGLPSAVLWGVMAAMLNFIPYIGALVGAGIVTVVGLVSFDSVTQGLMPPVIYIGFNVLESQFITPSVLGRRFTLNPVIIFITVIVWSWLWGVPGALIAIPLLVILKALCDHIEPLEKFGEFLRGRAA